MVLGHSGSDVAIAPYVAWESAMNVFATLCGRFSPDEVPVETVHEHNLMQRFLTVYNGRVDHIGPFKSTGVVHEGTVTDTEVRQNLTHVALEHVRSYRMTSRDVRGMGAYSGYCLVEAGIIARALLMKLCSSD